MMHALSNTQSVIQALFKARFDASKIVELSKARLTKEVFLVDWFSCIKFVVQATNIDWYFNHYGPYVEDVILVAQDMTDYFLVEQIASTDNSTWTKIKMRDDINLNDTGNKELFDLISKMIEKTADMSYPAFLNFVYGTFPIVSSQKYSKLPLVELSERYKAERG